jgi:hypothetical protein
MKATNLKLFLLTFLSVFVVSCDYEPVDGTLLGEDNNGGNNGGGGVTTGDYFPMALNNKWTYDGTTTDFVQQIIGTQNIDGFNYFRHNTSVSGPVTADTFTRKSNGNYFIRSGNVQLNFQGLVGTQTGYEFIALKDFFNEGQSWGDNISITTTYQGVPPIVTSGNYVATLTNKNVTETVAGETYQNVIKVRIVFTFSNPGAPSSSNTVTYWFAKDVGVIKTISQGITSETIDLTDYTLN